MGDGRPDPLGGDRQRAEPDAGRNGDGVRQRASGRPLRRLAGAEIGRARAVDDLHLDEPAWASPTVPTAWAVAGFLMLVLFEPLLDRRAGAVRPFRKGGARRHWLSRAAGVALVSAAGLAAGGRALGGLPTRPDRVIPRQTARSGPRPDSDSEPTFGIGQLRARSGQSRRPIASKRPREIGSLHRPRSAGSKARDASIALCYFVAHKARGTPPCRPKHATQNRAH
jgi:hypothetical protein